MLIVTLRRIAFMALLVIALAVGLSACGGSSSSSSSSEGATATEAAEGGTGGGGEVEPADSGVATAKEELAPYIGHPSAFPVTEKLKEVPKGASIAYVDCGSPVCALYYEIMAPVAKELGLTLQRYKGGAAANTVNTAFDSVISQEPDAVIVGSIDLPLWSQPLKELQEKEIPVITSGIVGAEEVGIESPQFANKGAEVEGRLLANYAAAEMGGEGAKDVVFYETPELSFTTLAKEVFVEQLEKVCPECSLRLGKVGLEEFGTTAPNSIVSDLQANPDTEIAVFASNEAMDGLPTALQAAGIEVETLGYAPAPEDLQYLKENKQTAAVGFDIAVNTYTMLDQAMREIVGQKLSGAEAEGVPVNQILTPQDITFDPSKGWTGYPEFAERFAKLWGTEG